MRPVLALLASLALLGLAACGGGNGDGDGDRLTRAQFVEQANAICVEYDQKVEDLGTPEDFDELRAFAEDARELTEEGIGEFRALEPPEELEARFDEYIEGGEELVALTGRLVDAAESQNGEEIQELLAEADRLNQESDRLSEELGLTDCASD